MVFASTFQPSATENVGVDRSGTVDCCARALHLESVKHRRGVECGRVVAHMVVLGVGDALVSHRDDALDHAVRLYLIIQRSRRR